MEEITEYGRTWLVTPEERERIRQLDINIAGYRKHAYVQAELRQSPFSALKALDLAVEEKRRILRASLHR